MSNLKVQIGGTTYQINEKAFRNTGWNKEPITPYFYVSHAAAGQLVKQFVKKNYPDVVCRVSSSSFAGGNSLDVHVCNIDGTPIPNAQFEAINNFANQFEYGRYDGMHDIYESYETSGLYTDNGTELKAGVKYVRTENRPAWDTPQYVLASIRSGESTWDTIGRYITPKVMEQARALSL
jgi:hypothetical protein